MAALPTIRPALASTRRRPNRAEQTNLTLFPHAACHGKDESAPAVLTPSPEALASPRSTGPAAELVGIARLAASSLRTQAKRGTEYFLLPVRSILNRCDSERVPFRWTVNPYRGCEFGCHYCYARYTHEFMELDGADFERKIYVKKNAGELAEYDLAEKKIFGEHIAIGTATDPYQPAEGEFGATRAILERMAERDGLSISITTKSDRVLRDLDLLHAISSRSALSVNITITTLRARLARLLEPRAPRPDLRLEAVRQLSQAGIAAGVNVMPVLPGITDSLRDLEELAVAAREAGAQWLAGSVLFLMPSAAKQFLPFIEAEFPQLAKQYKSWYARAAYAPEKYRQEMTKVFRELRRKHGLGSRPELPAQRAWRSPQIALPLPASCHGEAARIPTVST
jgi:DNA repair photolyase